MWWVVTFSAARGFSALIWSLKDGQGMTYWFLSLNQQHENNDVKSCALYNSSEISSFANILLRSRFRTCSLHFTVRLHVIAIAILSVRPSDTCIVTKRKNHLLVIQPYETGISSFSTPTGVTKTCPFSPEIFAQTDPPSSKNADFDRFPLITSQP